MLFGQATEHRASCMLSKGSKHWATTQHPSLSYFVKMYLSVCFGCMYICVLCACLVSYKPEGSTDLQLESSKPLWELTWVLCKYSEYSWSLGISLFPACLLDLYDFHPYIDDRTTLTFATSILVNRERHKNLFFSFLSTESKQVIRFPPTMCKIMT